MGLQSQAQLSIDITATELRLYVSLYSGQQSIFPQKTHPELPKKTKFVGLLGEK